MIETCPVADCTMPETHHHLDELDGKATPCDGSYDEYDRLSTCCQLGALYGPKEW
jgi:hypothetical protein